MTDAMTSDLLTYRCYRANALWFASLRQDAYSVTVRDGLTFSFAKGEMMGWAFEWAEKARLFWHGKHADNSECICPDCTRKAITCHAH